MVLTVLHHPLLSFTATIPSHSNTAHITTNSKTPTLLSKSHTRPASLQPIYKENNAYQQPFTFPYNNYAVQQSSQEYAPQQVNPDYSIQPGSEQFPYADYGNIDRTAQAVSGPYTTLLDPNAEYVYADYEYPEFEFNPPADLQIPGIDLANIDRKALMGSLQEGGLLGTLLELRQNPSIAVALGGLAAFGGYVSWAILSHVGVVGAALQLLGMIYGALNRVVFGEDQEEESKGRRRKRQVDDAATFVLEALKKFNENYSK